LEFLGEWGTRGEGPGKLSSPSGIAIDTVGNVYVVESFNRFVHKFTSKGDPLLSFQDDRTKYPGGIAVDSGGAIYVAAISGKQIIVFLPEGDRFRVIRSKSGPPFEGISSLCVDKSGHIFISESEGHRLRKLDAKGRQIAFWGRKTPRDAAIGRLGPAALSPDGALYVYDYDHSAMLMFNADLQFSLSWPVPEELLPVSGLAVSEKYVFTIAEPSRLAVWTREGRLERTDDLGRRIRGGDALPPVDLAFIRPNQLLVLDELGARVLRFRINF
jgi:streptogramin lyase